MDLWRLHIFCKVVELKSFSMAGKTVHLSQPTVSSHIKVLEDHFGCRLIDRLSKEVLPTKAGEILYHYARKLISLRDETETAMSDFQGVIKGRLVVGGSTIPGNYILPKLIGAFISDYPEVTLSVVIGDTQRIINDTLSGDLEFGIVGAKANDKKIFQQVLLNDRLVLIIYKGHAWSRKKSIGLKDLVKEPFVIRKHGSGTLKAIQHGLARKGFGIEDLNIVAEMGSTEAVCQGVKNRVGVSVLSPRAVSEDLKTGVLKALAIDDLDVNQCFYLTRHKYRSISPLGETFINYLKEKLPTL